MKTLMMAVASIFRRPRLLKQEIAEVPKRRATRYEVFLMLTKLGLLTPLKSSATRPGTFRAQSDVYAMFLDR